VRLFEEILVSEDRSYSMRPLASVFLCCVMLAGLLVYAPSRAEALPNDSLIAGTVTDGVDPIEGAYVKVLMMMAEGIEVNYSFSDATGYYDIGVPGGFDYMVFAVHEDHYFVMASASVGPSETVTVDLTMTAIVEPKDVTIKGFVEDELGSPVTEGNVLAIAADPSGMPVYCNITQPDVAGYFELMVIASPYGGGAIILDLPGYNMMSNESSDPIESGMTYWFNLTLKSTTYSDDCHVSGTVADGYGTPLEGVLVSIRTWNEYMSDEYSNYTSTDSLGYYDLNFTSGSVEITFVKGGYTNYAKQFSADAGTDMTLDVGLYEFTGEMHGNVTDLSTGIGIPDAQVMQMFRIQYSPDNWAAWYSIGYTDGYGYYEMPVWPSDGFNSMVGAQADGYSNNWTQMDVSGSGILWMDFGLWQLTAWLEGYVTDYMTSLPIENAWIWAQSDIYSDGTNTDASGYYNISLVPGEYTVNVNAMGYRNEQTTVDVPDGTTTVQDFELWPATAWLDGYVTDYFTGSPIENAWVWAQSDTYSDGKNTDASGYYNISLVPGEYTVYVNAMGYMNEQTTVDVPDGTTAVQDFELWPVNSLLEGYVTDYMTGDIIEYAWVWAQSDTYSDGAETDGTGYYSIPVPQGEYTVNVNAMDYRNAQATVDVPNGMTVVQDFALLPWDLPDSTRLYGWINTSGTAEPIMGAEIRVALEDLSDQNSTMSNETGYYEIMVPSVPLAYRVTATNHALGYGWVDTTGLSELRMDVLLDPDIWSPNVTYSQTPTENITWTNPSMISAEVEESNLNSILLFQFMYCGASGDWDQFYIVDGASTSFDPWNPGGDLPYSVADDIYTIDTSWNGSAAAGWLANGTDQAYLGAFEVPMYGTEWYYVLRGYYSNSTLTMPQSGSAFFDQSTDAFAMFVFDDQGSYGVAYPDDATGVLSPGITRIDVDRTNPTSWMWYNGATLGNWSVADLSFTYDEVAPSVAYKTLFIALDFGNRGFATMTNLTVDNDPPVADAGIDQTAVVNTTVTLDASGSSDNVGIVSYTWEYTDSMGIPVVLTVMTVDVVFDVPEDYLVTLTVVDGGGHSVTDSVLISVSADEVPVADAGPDQSVDEGTVVSFDGVDSSDDLGIDNYTWTIDELDVEMYGIAPEYTFVQPDTYHVELVVEDTIGQVSLPNEMVVTVADVTDPTADAGADQEVDIGTEVTLDAGGSSDNVAIASWEWTFDDDGAKSLPDETATYTFENAGEFTVTLRVEDAAGNYDTDTVIITVIDTEAPFADAGEDVSVVVGGTVTLNGTGSSDNVGIVSYTWTFTDVTAQILTGAEPEYPFENEGDFTIMLTVVDAEGLPDTDEVVVHVLPENAVPTADAGDDQIVTEGDTVTLDGTGSTDDGGAEALNYTWTFEYDGETVTRYGAEVEFTFEIPGEYDVTLTVEDEDGLTSTDSVTITVEETSATFIEQYWWALAALAAVIVVAAAVVLFMKKGKGGAPSKKAPKKDEDADDEMEDEDEPPAPREEEEL